MADSILIPFEPRYVSPRLGELGHLGSSNLLLQYITMLIPTVARPDLENDAEMWNLYLNEVKEDDNRVTDAWKEDANSIVTFVSHNLLCPYVHLGDNIQDGSFLRNCWRIHH